MAQHTWIRPKSVPYPSVWSKFARKNKNGQEMHFEIQDITEDLFPACIEFMKKYFLPNEPMYACLDFLSDAASIKEMIDWWQKVLPEKLSLICLEKDPENPDASFKIAGMNILYYHHKSHDEGDAEFKGEKFKTICEIVKHLEDQIDRYQLLNTEEYIDEFGLCVDPNYRCMGIATELLKARSALGNAVGLNVTFTIFSAIASQRAADKAGFKNLVEMKYSDIAKLFPPYVLNVKDTPTIRYTYKLLSSDAQ